MRYILNQSNGTVTELVEDQVDLLRDFEVILKQKPKGSCKQCYGRGFIGRNEAKIMWVPCFKCLKKCVDKEALSARVQQRIAQQPIKLTDEQPSELF